MNAVIATLVMTHITIACVTLYLHRSQAHRSVEFHPIVSHTMRFWLWLTTGMVTREWVAVHRRHHQSSDQLGDPHSPKVHGLAKVFFGGAFLYAKATKDPDVMKLGVGCPDDWMERHVYTPHNVMGIMLMLILDLLFFGPWGLVVWLIQMIWIPLWAAGVINGLAHSIGYRNYDVKDTSRNLVPLGVWIGGEELHNNHHGNGASAKLSLRWYEIDIGWIYIQLLKSIGLAKLRNTSS